MITDPLPRSSLSRTAIRQLPVLASNPKNLNRSPKRQDVQLFFFLSLPVAGCPNGGGFLVNGHDVDVMNRAKFTVLREIEADLPVALFTRERETYRRDRRRSLSNVERLIPGCFALLYAVMLVAAVVTKGS